MNGGRARRRDPAPAEIEQMCAEIRDRWDDRTFWVRAGIFKNYEEATVGRTWTPPVVDASELDFVTENTL